MPAPEVPQVLRKRAVLARTGLSAATLYRLIDAGNFPSPIQLGPRCVGWISGEVDDWIDKARAERDARIQSATNADVAA
jgi:prophage regulatory protein